MCLAVPAKIIRIDEQPDDPVTGRVATVDLQGSQIEASLAMTPEADVGSWVLVHAGFALTVLDEEEARETFATLDAALIDPSAPPAAGPASP